VTENGVSTGTSAVEAPGKFTDWQKYLAKGNSGMIKVYLVVCRKLVLSGMRPTVFVVIGCSYGSIYEFIFQSFAASSLTDVFGGR
jgi:hypothetical protein